MLVCWVTSSATSLPRIPVPRVLTSVPAIYLLLFLLAAGLVAFGTTGFVLTGGFDFGTFATCLRFGGTTVSEKDHTTGTLVLVIVAASVSGTGTGEPIIPDSDGDFKSAVVNVTS